MVETDKPTMGLVLERVHPDDWKLVQRAIESAANGGEDYDYECRLLLPSGALKYLTSREIRNGRMTKPDGMGMALAICRSTIEAH